MLQNLHILIQLIFKEHFSCARKCSKCGETSNNLSNKVLPSATNIILRVEKIKIIKESHGVVINVIKKNKMKANVRVESSMLQMAIAQRKVNII